MRWRTSQSQNGRHNLISLEQCFRQLVSLSNLDSKGQQISQNKEVLDSREEAIHKWTWLVTTSNLLNNRWWNRWMIEYYVSTVAASLMKLLPKDIFLTVQPKLKTWGLEGRFWRVQLGWEDDYVNNQENLIIKTAWGFGPKTPKPHVFEFNFYNF